jgi:hypothetical protein
VGNGLGESSEALMFKEGLEQGEDAAKEYIRKRYAIRRCREALVAMVSALTRYATNWHRVRTVGLVYSTSDDAVCQGCLWWKSVCG